jgi:ring-1,2-phenylacetyl-CoA epoxidase subunit PaaD
VVSVASGAIASPSGLVADVWHALDQVMDPEIPAVSVVDLGMIHRVDASPHAVRVEILPTFMGCPAIDAIRLAIAERLADLTERVEVSITFEIPWTTDRISQRGRERLRANGFGPPATMAAGGENSGLITLQAHVACPYCGSPRTVLDSAFGPTLCRSIYYCTDCRQPFEQFKTV